MSEPPSPIDFVGESTIDVARRLIGCLLERRLDGGVLSGRIVETEAYVEGDAASHAYGGRTARNGSMFGPPGTIYVYRIHQSRCLNVVTAPEGKGEAVLIRALEPVEGIEVMQERRRNKSLRNLTNGPGKLCQAMGIDLGLDGGSIYGRELTIRGAATAPTKVLQGPRVGVTKNASAAYRMIDPESRCLSRAASWGE